jgi:hypothetical protein
MIYSIFAMILLTFGVAGYMLKLRVAAVKSGTVKLSAFCLNNPDSMPPKLLQAARNYSNLFEVPVLFYAAGVLSISLGMDSTPIVILGWLFVVSRLVHSWIHLTTNNVIRRMQAFMVGNICVLLIWILILWEYSISH